MGVGKEVKTYIEYVDMGIKYFNQAQVVYVGKILVVLFFTYIVEDIFFPTTVRYACCFVSGVTMRPVCTGATYSPK